METIILNNTSEAEKIFQKNENNPIENLDLLSTQENKKKKSKKNTKKKQKQKSKKKYSGLKDLLDDIKKEKITQTNQKISEENTNEKNDDSEINFPEKLEIETKAGDVSESDINEFKEFFISPKSEIKSPRQKNFFRKMTSIENEQLNNLNNDKRKMTFSICDYYSGYDKYLSETENSTIDLSSSLNFIKKEKFEENFSEEIENNNSNNNINEDFFNNNSQNNNNNLQNINNNPNNKQEFFENSKKYINYRYMPEIILLDSKYSKFDIYNSDYYTNCKFNCNGNYIVRRRGDWLCDKCGNYNYSFRDVCNRCKNPKSPNY